MKKYRTKSKMPNYEIILSKDKPYNRFIHCIVKNSFLKYFASDGDLPSHVVIDCLNASVKTITPTDDKQVMDFLCQVDLYRDIIIHHCKYFIVNNNYVFEAPRKHLELKILRFLDSKRDLILRKNKRGQFPKSVAFAVLKQAALYVNKLTLESNSSDDYLKYLCTIYTTVGKKWWRTRVTYGENVQPSSAPQASQDSLGPAAEPVKSRNSYEIPYDHLPLKKRILTDLRPQDESYDLSQAAPVSTHFPNTDRTIDQPYASIDTGHYQIIAHHGPSLNITITRRESLTQTSEL